MDADKPSELPPIQKEGNKPTKTITTSFRNPKAMGGIFMLLVAVSAGFLGGWLGADSRKTNLQDNNARQQIVSTESQLISQIAKNVGPSVVSVNVVSQGVSNSFFGFGQPVE